MASFRLIVSEAPDLTTVHIAGRLGDEAVTPLREACGRGRRPIVLDLSQTTGASDAGVLLLRRLSVEGVHLLGASPYVAMLLAVEEKPARPARRGRPAPDRGRSQARATHRKSRPA